jgi:hypothetical protein
MEKMAVIRDVGIGMRDAPYPCLWFSTYVSEAGAALQVLTWEQAEKLVRDTGVRDVRDLEGKPCWVEESAGMIKFVRVWAK